MRWPRFSRRRTLAKNLSRSLAAKAQWADPVRGEKIRAAARDPARRAKSAEIAKARWADPETRTKIVAAMRAAGERRRSKTSGL